MSQVETTTRRIDLRSLSAGAALALGVVILPALLAIIFNSYAAPDAEAYVRMAFAQVAGATIAMGTAIGLAVLSVIRRKSARTIIWLSIIAAAVTVWQLTALARASDFLLTGLGLVS